MRAETPTAPDARRRKITSRRVVLPAVLVGLGVAAFLVWGAEWTWADLRSCQVRHLGGFGEYRPLGKPSLERMSGSE